MYTQSDKLLVGSVMLSLDRVPVVKEAMLFKQALEEMDRKYMGICCIVDDKNNLLGVITDGDVRRRLLKIQKPLSALFVDDAIEHAVRTPISVGSKDTLESAVELMGQRKVWDLPVVDGRLLLGLLHLHPAIQELMGQGFNGS